MSENFQDKKIILYSCAGGSNVGEIADRTARKLRADGVGQVSCLAGIGAGLPNYIETAQKAGMAVVIDGCPIKCGQKIFEKNNLKAKFYELSNFGYEKGKTPVTPETIDEAAQKIKAQL